MKTFKLLLVVLTANIAIAGDVIINEIHYHPDEKTDAEEFIELFNRGSEAVDLSGWFFAEGVDFTFPEGTSIGPGEFVVVGEDPDTLAETMRYPNALGPFVGRLSNDGERVILMSPDGAVEDQVDYRVRFPWPIASDGRGSSMELINPNLNNNLGGSWRASGQVIPPDLERSFLLNRESDWFYRKALSEPSDPPEAWRALDFAQDESWVQGQASIGYGDDDDNTVLEDMEDTYIGIYMRKRFQVKALDDISSVIIGTFVDDGAIIWINGIEVMRTIAVGDGERTFEDGTRGSREARWAEFLIANAGSFLKEGENIIAVHAMNQRVTSNDFSADFEIFTPGREDFDDDFVLLPPSPGSRSSVFSETPPAQIRQVEHLPEQPAAGDDFLIRARISEASGIEKVELLYQVVEPGNYIPAFSALSHPNLISRATSPRVPNPDFEDPDNWIVLEMKDDGQGLDQVAGDGVFSVRVPGQVNRTILRYRIQALARNGTSVRVPHADDESLNFAAWIYDGVPAYEASTRSVHPEGRGHVYSEEVMNSLPVYTIVTKKADWDHCIAYSGSFQIPKSNEPARDRFNWEGAFVYRGKVYDHIRYRLRQANDRYGGQGKRSMRIRFNRGRYVQAHNNYGVPFPERWKTINTGKMFDNKRVGNFGLTEQMNHDLWNAVGVPAPWVYTFHMRVVRGVDEVPASQSQFLGDFFGMHLVFENYDQIFLDTHTLEDGNLYKLKDGQFNGNDLRRNQGRFATTTDRDFQNIRSQLRPQRDNEWLDAHVNYDRWYRYHAVVEGIRHYDFVPADSHSKNRAWYFEPDYSGSEFGRLWTLPWDSDASWGPNWNSGVDYSKNAISSGAAKRPFRRAYRNFLREFRDLVWTEEDMHQRIDDLAARVVDFSKADRDRWRSAPGGAGSQDFGPMETKVLDMKRFAFVAWSGGSGPSVPAGGRARHLDALAAAEGMGAQIPTTPVVEPTDGANFPIDQLTFAASAFDDPQGDAFAAIAWRIGEITPPGTPFDPNVQRKYEFPALWEEEFSTFESTIQIPEALVVPGRTYRVRARMKDEIGNWSHWSAPVEFVASEPSSSTAAVDGLRVSELMYNPVGDENFEFIELVNAGSESIDLTEVRFGDALEFSFADGAITSLDSGAYVLVVRNRRVFETRYGPGLPIAGEYRGQLANGGERLELLQGAGRVIQDFVFADEWHPQADGLGFSLVVRDPNAELSAWGRPEGWRASHRPQGSPGVEDLPGAKGSVRPGDVNVDGRTNLTDAVGILRHLFLGELLEPCQTAEAHSRVLDVDGDMIFGVTDAVRLLNWLFRRGAPPHLGVDCVEIESCVGACQ